jgi:hypothetical protein
VFSTEVATTSSTDSSTSLAHFVHPRFWAPTPLVCSDSLDRLEPASRAVLPS